MSEEDVLTFLAFLFGIEDHKKKKSMKEVLSSSFDVSADKLDITDDSYLYDLLWRLKQIYVEDDPIVDEIATEALEEIEGETLPFDFTKDDSVRNKIVTVTSFKHRKTGRKVQLVHSLGKYYLFEGDSFLTVINAKDDSTAKQKAKQWLLKYYSSNSTNER